jgi:hypothetical protein
MMTALTPPLSGLGGPHAPRPTRRGADAQGQARVIVPLLNHFPQPESGR